MQSIFNQEYFKEKEFIKPDTSSLLPPEFQDSDSDSEYETAGYQLKEDLHCEDEGFNMDADYIEERPRKKGKTAQVYYTECTRIITGEIIQIFAENCSSSMLIYFSSLLSRRLSKDRLLFE